jgi:lysophospholipase L1-like esterase
MAIAYLKYTVWANYSIAPLGRLYLAKAHHAKGDRESADKVIVSPVVAGYSDDLPIRLDTDYNEIMKQVARDESVELVNAAKELDDRPSVYVDLAHFNAEGHRRVAELLAPRIRQMLKASHNRILP